MTTKKLVVFDLDGTLAVSKSAIDPEMSSLLGVLLRAVKVAVISGGDAPQFLKQVIQKLPDGANFQNLSMLPTCGTKFYRFVTHWGLLYSEDLSPDQKQKITAALTSVAQSSDLHIDKTWGQVIEDRGTQITYSALGQEAPIEAKAKWDPDFAKRKKMKTALDKLLPEFSVNLGGTTSIDVTKPGIDKGYGIRKLRDTLGIALDEMIFVGDALFPGGNDYPAEQAGVASIRVKDPEQTKRVIETIIACLDSSLAIKH